MLASDDCQVLNVLQDSAGSPYPTNIITSDSKVDADDLSDGFQTWLKDNTNSLGVTYDHGMLFTGYDSTSWNQLDQTRLHQPLPFFTFTRLDQTRLDFCFSQISKEAKSFIFVYICCCRYNIIADDGTDTILGRATVGGICKTAYMVQDGSLVLKGSLAISINEHTGPYTSASTGAHELGHKYVHEGVLFSIVGNCFLY